MENQNFDCIQILYLICRHWYGKHFSAIYTQFYSNLAIISGQFVECWYFSEEFLKFIDILFYALMLKDLTVFCLSYNVGETKTTGKTIKLNIWFSPILLKVFFSTKLLLSSLNKWEKTCLSFFDRYRIGHIFRLTL